MSTTLSFLIAGCGELRSPTAPIMAGCANPAPLITHDKKVPGQYIVDLADGVEINDEARRLAAKYKFRILEVFVHVLGGFAAEMSDAAVAGVRCEPSVKSVSEDPIGDITGWSQQGRSEWVWGQASRPSNSAAAADANRATSPGDLNFSACGSRG